MEQHLEDMSNPGPLPPCLCDPAAHKAPELEKHVVCLEAAQNSDHQGSGPAGFMLFKTPVITLKIRGAITKHKLKDRETGSIHRLEAGSINIIGHFKAGAGILEHFKSTF